MAGEAQRADPGRPRGRPQRGSRPRLVGSAGPDAGDDASERVEVQLAEVTQEDVALAKLISKAQAAAAVAQEHIRASTPRPTW
ncbi:MAG TPA: hypothetical protein VFA63_18450 [Pseudonocardiaceae bacterium]|nr:hypothetical protein [Pseudonocardiaceae bacterium]